MPELEPTDYAATLEEIKRRVHEARYRAQRKANTELLRLYWQIGHTILTRQLSEPWGAKVLERLADDQLGFYVAVVDDRLRIPGKHQPTVGMLLVASKNDTVVRHALAGTAQPVAVSRYDLSPAAQAALPAEGALARIALQNTSKN